MSITREFRLRKELLMSSSPYAREMRLPTSISLPSIAELATSPTILRVVSLFSRTAITFSATAMDRIWFCVDVRLLFSFLWQLY